jgi:hypothetical protein
MYIFLNAIVINNAKDHHCGVGSAVIAFNACVSESFGAEFPIIQLGLG